MQQTNPQPAVRKILAHLLKKALSWWIRKKSENTFFVIPANAGTQSFQSVMDSDFRRSNGIGTFYEAIYLKGLKGLKI